MKTKFTSREAAIENRKWVVVDADNQIVGRLASEVAKILRGKNKPNFASHTDVGDYVIVINAEKVRFSGLKEDAKVYHRHTGFVGGVKSETAAELRAKKPEDIIVRAVKGMLPKTTLGRSQMKKLKVYPGAEHPHSAQTPEVVSF